jgi:MoaA/NifB/PqqE/SkfB family radical SAM enzyme
MGLMAPQVFEVIREKVVAARAFEAVYLSGMGEPTLNPHLVSFVRALTPHFWVSLTTNAALLDAERAVALRDAGLDALYVSFSGHEADLYERMMGGLHFERANRHVREIVHAAGGQMGVFANVSVTPLTRPHLPEIRQHLQDLGVQHVVFALCHNRGGFLPDCDICDTPLPPSGQGRCDVFRDTLYVAWDGRVLSCCHDLRGEGQVGDLLQEGLIPILARKQRILEEGVRFPMCARCNDMYRFGEDPTPDRRPLSEWVYLLAGEDRHAALLEVVKRQEARIEQLERQIAAYESGRLMRLANWLGRTRQRARELLGG